MPTLEQLAIPQAAVLDTGTRTIVFVREREGTFRPREVKLGARMAGHYPVLSGLAEGERVVSSPNFLIDSESRLQAILEAARSGAGPDEGHTH
jgi:Cu(I)/Ag(I) efflux system membrane fusion protein